MCLFRWPFRRPFMEWGSTTRLYDWPGIRLSWFLILRMLMRQNQKRMRFVDISHFFCIHLILEVSTYKWRYLNVSYQKSVLNVLSLHFQSTRGSHYILYQGLSLCSFCVATFIKQWACLQGDTQNKKSFHFGSLLNHP